MSFVESKDRLQQKVVRPEDEITLHQVFDIAFDDGEDGVAAATCIDQCNAACYIPGAQDGAQVTSFHKKHTPS